METTTTATLQASYYEEVFDTYYLLYQRGREFVIQVVEEGPGTITCHHFLDAGAAQHAWDAMMPDDEYPEED